jgi:GNAT superfamily N-acetyltransferase
MNQGRREQAIKDRQFYIRVVTGNDRERLRGMFARSSPETIYRRFHIPYLEIPEWMLSLMADPGDGDKGFLVAVVGEEIVGHAMYVRERNEDEAEMAIAVEDRWQSKGIGKALLQELAQRARPRGIDTFTGDVLGHNRPLLGLTFMLPGTDYTSREGVYTVRMPLQTSEPAARQHTGRRAA